jgi:hypothetical protein
VFFTAPQMHNWDRSTYSTRLPKMPLGNGDKPEMA